LSCTPSLLGILVNSHTRSSIITTFNMTVDDKSFYLFAQTNPEKAREHIAAVREVTGTVDDEEIKRALDKTREVSGEFNLSRAIDILLAGSNTHTVAVLPSSTLPTTSMVPPSSSPHKPKVVDLTEENKSEDDLQRAIALSLQDGGVTNLPTHSTTATSTVSGVTQEEQDVSKALEASLLESTQGRRKKDSQNPHDRQRDGEWPVGLKNVGQTCWFSAVIQSLFHLPAFRTLVLNFTPPQHLPQSDKERKILEFMSELRKLFVLLLSSQRKYVDPSRAVGILRGSLGGGEGGQGTSNQQDVSEFTHKLLDWLEEAFRLSLAPAAVKTEESVTCGEIVKKEAGDNSEPMDSESEKMDKEKESVSDKDREDMNIPESEPSGVGGKVSPSMPTGKNPMFSLFYGKVEIEGSNQGVQFSRCEQFGQWPLQVNGYKHIHDSLEASTAYQAIDSGEGSSSGQERWFTTLPPVLFLELSRFQFNTSRGIAEKVNNVLEFPEEIYLDRYLEVNKGVVRDKREQVRRLVDRRNSLQQQLDRFLQYGPAQSSQKFPLANILRSALEFARSGAEPGGGMESDSCMQVDSPCPSPASLTPASSLANLATEGVSTNPLEKSQLPDGSISIPIIREEADPAPPTDMEVEASPLPTTPRVNNSPAPRHVSELELKVLSSCLGRWGKEVEEEIANLNKALQDISAAIAVMYEEPCLRQRGYRLHAVMVHEGDVNQGHYWAYVNHKQRGCWLKFNDNTVSQATWEEIKKEAVGGRASTSAYSCVYVDIERGDLMDQVTPPLPSDLDLFIMEDNKSFASEIVKWDEEQLRLKSEPAPVPATPGPTSQLLIGDDPECQIIEQKPQLAQSHALLAKEATLEHLAAVAAMPAEKKKAEGKSNTSYMINRIYQAVKQKVGQCKQEGFGERQDPRLDSFIHYLVANDLSVDLYRRALLEQVALQEFEMQGEVGRDVARTARDTIRQMESQIEQEILLWHRAYHQFRIVVNYFVLGVEKYTENILEESLELLTTSYVVNEKIAEEPPQTQNGFKAMFKRGLIKHFHLAVESLNTRLVEQFETGSDPGSVAGRVASTLVPAIHILQARTNKVPGGRDAALLEEVRGRWCAMIEQPLPDRKRDYWGTIFNTVVPDDNSVVMKQPPIVRYPKLADDLKLGQRYKSAMQRIMRETEK